MKDPLKTFIEQHRDEFDNATPDDALVERTACKLSSHQPERNASRIPAWIKISSAACALAFVSYLTIRMTVMTSDPKNMHAVGNKATLSYPDPLLQRIDPGSAHEMQLLAQEASQRESGLTMLRKDDPALYQRFLKDLSELDSVYHSLREMLTRTPNHQQLIEAMEENLQMRLQLLERQHDIIQDIKRNKNSRS